MPESIISKSTDIFHLTLSLKLYSMRIIIVIGLALVQLSSAFAQRGFEAWSPDGLSLMRISSGNIVRLDPKSGAETIVVTKEQCTPQGFTAPLKVQSFAYSQDRSKLLLFANTAKVWRLKTKGDYWVYHFGSNQLKQIGRSLKAQTLMFAKFSPDGKYVAYVSESNLFVEDVATGMIKKLTNDGSRKLINGTFDWVYEEEFSCRDGFRWSPDGRHIAFWQVDARKVGDYYMFNTTDSNYSKVIPVEYPKVGEPPSPVKIGVVNVQSGATRWMNFEGDPQQHYITRLEWSTPGELMVQRLNRKQQESKLIYCNIETGNASTFWADNDKAWVDLNAADIFDEPGGFTWVNIGAEFLWVSEKDGWRHIYKISRDGRNTTLLTKGDYDIRAMLGNDDTYVYFTASPNNATQLYLYRVKINGVGKNELEQLTPALLKGWNDYKLSPNAKLAKHTFSNSANEPSRQIVSLPDHKVISNQSIPAPKPSTIEYLSITTEDNIVLDAWISKPANFDPSKKYPIVFYVYGEPASSTVEDQFGSHNNFLYAGDMANDGYIQASIDVRGTPSLKGAGWRKAIYRKIGQLNIRDFAMGAKKILENSWIDKERVAVWGWSGGGSSTLNLMFQYPEIFKTGIAIAAVANQLFYDNIYQERYMGLPQENKEDFIKGSPASNVKGLQGKLLYIHGTGDDNVHYSNAEYLINELIKHNKQFEFMAYPNRSHNISEGQGTFMHLATLYTNFLKKNCPPGAR